MGLPGRVSTLVQGDWSPGFTCAVPVVVFERLDLARATSGTLYCNRRRNSLLSLLEIVLNQLVKGAEVLV